MLPKRLFFRNLKENNRFVMTPTQLRFAGRQMATVLPRNRGLKTCGHRSKKDIACRSGTPLKPHTMRHPLSSVPYRHASFIIDLSLRVQEPSVTRQGGRPRRPSSHHTATTTIITIPHQHRRDSSVALSDHHPHSHHHPTPPRLVA